MEEKKRDLQEEEDDTEEIIPVDGEIEIAYNQKKNSKYSNQPDRPVESMMWKNKF